MNIGMMFLLITISVSAIELVMILFYLLYGRKDYLKFARYIYFGSGILIVLAVFYLVLLFLSNDFRFTYIYSNSSIHLPIIYKITALWSGQEGSFILWLMILFIVGVIAILIDREHDDIVLLITVITKIFILVSLIIKNPFELIWTTYPDLNGMIPQDGIGMNPLLQDAWMIVHPPLLYIGYATAVIPFSYAVASFVKNKYSLLTDKGYPWIVISFTSLGIGIFMGGYWAYKVLGWGGFWGWDPVENSSLIPWIAVTALVHGMVLQKRIGTLVKTNLFLSMVFMILVFLSFFLTRSGLLSNFSVHSFGESGLSIYLFSFMMFYLIITVIFFICKYRTIESKKLPAGFWNQPSVTSLGILLLGLFSLFILFGTTLPILSGIISENPLSADLDYYNAVAQIFGPAIVICMIIATMNRLRSRCNKVKFIIMAVVSLAAGIILLVGTMTGLELSILVVLSLFLVLQNSYDLCFFRIMKIVPSRIAHIGVGIMILGFVASDTYSTADQDRIYQNEEKTINSISLTLLGYYEEPFPGIKYRLLQDGKDTTVTTKYYFNERMNSIYREPYIQSGFGGDIYIYPDDYQSGLSKASIGLAEKNKESVIGGIRVVFKEFHTKNMTSEKPSISALMTVNGHHVEPAMHFSKSEKTGNKVLIPGTQRTLSLIDIDVNNKAVWIHISPDETTVIPPDSVIVNVSQKRYIWLVWAGTLLIALGGWFALTNSATKK